MVVANNSCGTEAQVRYSLSKSNTIKDLFHIDIYSGIVCLRSELDYEERTSYQFQVYAQNSNERSSQAQVIVNVQNVNDNYPIFYTDYYNVSILQNAAINTPLILLSANDADEGVFGKVYYRFSNNKTNDFRLDSNSGRLYIQNKLSKKNYKLRIEAFDGGGLISQRKAVINIVVTSSSTGGPQFTSSLYKFSVSEEALPDVVIGRVKVEGSHPINYTIYSGNCDDLFAINTTNGQLSVAQYLDAIKWDEMLLNVKAWMADGRTNYTQVLIKLVDFNDNDPMFVSDKMEVYVYENHPINQTFFAAQAFDRDRGKNGKLSYVLVQSEPPCPVSIQPLDGHLKFTASIDYEAINKYNLILEARDQGKPPRSANISVLLNVLDVNDNKPIFESQSYTVEIPENIPSMTDILTIKAKDLDSKQNAKLSYYLREESHFFGIHAASGNIFVKSSLDRETIAEHFLLVIATDHGMPKLSSQATVHVKILDVNDNSPSCPSVNSFTVSDDDEIGTTFGKLVASDPDEGLNGSLTYHLQVEDVNFALRNNGELLLKKKQSGKDYKNEVLLSVIVSDRDGDVQAQSTICSIRIIVGKGDKIKFLEPLDRIIRISEKCMFGCSLKVLNATNAAKWEIEVNDISNNFEIWNNTLRTSKYFNETTIKNGRTLTVIASDVDGQYKKKITFTIQMSTFPMPLHDDKTIVVKTSKMASVGSKLITINQETNGKSVWRLENETDLFYLDSITSTLYLTTSFRQNDHGSYLLKVQELLPPYYFDTKQRDVYIVVEPANIHWPRFHNCPQIFSVKENEPTGSVIGKLFADDADGGDSGQLSYSIVQGSIGLFSIDPDTAEILLIRSLRWEKDISLFLVVEAEDNDPNITKRKRSRCVVVINVEDINNNAPHFESSNNITVDVHFTDGDIIHYVVATDDDDNINGKITYSIIDGNMDNAFSVDPETGAVVLHHRFIGERNICIRASDNGKPQKFTEKNAVVKYSSGHHRQWEFFQHRKYTISLKNDSAPGTVLYDFFANENGWLTRMKLFSQFVPEDERLQLLDNGKLIMLKHFEAGTYSYIVTATKEELLTDWASIELLVHAGNQHPPRIASSSCGNISIPENLAAERLTRVYAFDRDNGIDGEVFYKIIAGNENSVFYMNSSSGLLSCDELDRERQSEYFLIITAEDEGVPKRADTCTLRITVIDENDNVPIFDKTTPNFIDINDRTQIGEVLARLSAKDEDEGPSGKVVYSIVEDGSGLLDINPATGEIIFARDQPTLHQEYVVKVKAEDQGVSKVLASERNIQLRIKRLKTMWDSTEPQFLSEHYVGFIKEGEGRGQFVLQVRSSDRLTEDAPLAYSIVSGNVDAAFHIDQDGRIITAQELDYEIENIYNLKVIGTGNMKHVAETDVHIRVINTNDNIPSFPKLRSRKVLESANYGTLIATIVATDVDVDAQLEYKLLTPNDLFEINPFTGKLFLVGTLDYEMKREHVLEVQVADGENTSRATLLVNVEDVNDNAPKFEEEFYWINVSEDIKVGSKVARIGAYDPDTGPGGTIRYTLAKNSTDKFRIDPESGNLWTATKLENRMIYYVKVVASDQGKPSLVSTVIVRINVGDEDNNRNVLRFTKNLFSFTISENTPPHIEFGKVSLVDGISSNVMLRIQDPEMTEVFQLAHDGSISLKQSVDSDFRNEYEFTIEAMASRAAFNASAKVRVSITDVNDNVPYFVNKITEITISERLKTNDVLTKFLAIDHDSGDNGRISYQILSGNDFGMFHLNDSTGVLCFEKIDDEEKYLNGTFEDLVVAAFDNGIPPRWNWTSVQVHLEVQYTSTNAPTFVLPHYDVVTFENLPIGSIILRPKAFNKFGFVGNDWIYALTDNDESFTCNKTTGHIILAKQLDYETETNYEFILGVKNGLNQSASVPIRVHVLGIDEYPPVFIKSTYVFQISRVAQVGQRIGVVRAIDEDMGADGEIRYEIDGNTTHYFTIDGSTGLIVLSQQLHKKRLGNVTCDEFVVRASSAQQSTHAKVIIQIGDFSGANMFATDSLTTSQILTIVSLLLLFILLITLFVVIINMKMRNVEKPKKQIYSVSKGNVAMVSDLNRRSPIFGCEKQQVPCSLSPSSTGFKASSLSSATNISNVPVRQLPKPPLEFGNHSGSQSMPDSGIDPDDMSVTSSVTEYLSRIGVTHNKHFDSKDGLSSKERFTGHKYNTHDDSEISDLIYAKVDEILSPESRMNVSFTSNSSIGITSFNENVVNVNAAPEFQPLTELLMDLRKKQRHFKS